MFKQKLVARTLPLTGVFLLSLGVTSGVNASTTAQANLAVNASVTANCTITTTAVAFGAYDPVSANASTALNGTGALNVTCTSGASATLTLGQGANADTGSTDTVPARRMNDGGTNFLSYTLYSEPTRTTVWGNTAPTGLAITGSGTQVAETVYGTVAAGQNVPAGTYSDTVVATVTF